MSGSPAQRTSRASSARHAGISQRAAARSPRTRADERALREDRRAADAMLLRAALFGVRIASGAAEQRAGATSRRGRDPRSAPGSRRPALRSCASLCPWTRCRRSARRAAAAAKRRPGGVRRCAARSLERLSAPAAARCGRAACSGSKSLPLRGPVQDPCGMPALRLHPAVLLSPACPSLDLDEALRKCPAAMRAARPSRAAGLLPSKVACSAAAQPQGERMDREETLQPLRHRTSALCAARTCTRGMRRAACSVRARGAAGSAAVLLRSLRGSVPRGRQLAGQRGYAEGAARGRECPAALDAAPALACRLPLDPPVPAREAARQQVQRPRPARRLCWSCAGGQAGSTAAKHPLAAHARARPAQPTRPRPALAAPIPQSTPGAALLSLSAPAPSTPSSPALSRSIPTTRGPTPITHPHSLSQSCSSCRPS
jgi:hypothetical protein